jgi:hypothetical protein
MQPLARWRPDEARDITDKFPVEPHIAGTAWDWGKRQVRFVSCDGVHDFLSLSAKARRKVELCPGFDSATSRESVSISLEVRCLTGPIAKPAAGPL